MRFINPTDSMFAGVCPAPSCPSCGGEGCCAPGQCVMGQNEMPYAVEVQPNPAQLPPWAYPTAPRYPNPPPECGSCDGVVCCPPSVCKTYCPFEDPRACFRTCTTPAGPGPKPGSATLAAVIGPWAQMPGAGVIRHAASAARSLGSNPATISDRDEMCCVC